jgi:hypothetical protein
MANFFVKDKVSNGEFQLCRHGGYCEVEKSFLLLTSSQNEYFQAIQHESVFSRILPVAIFLVNKFLKI